MLNETNERPDADEAEGAATGPHARPRAPQPAVTDLADSCEFARMADRQALRGKRHGEAQAALVLEVLFPTPAADALRQPLLAECTRRLCSRVRSTDTVTRWQLSHFGVLLPRCAPEHAEAVLARLIEFVGGHYRLRSKLLDVQLQGRVFGRGGPASGPVILP